MSLLNGAVGRFLPVASSPTCSLSRPSASSTSLERSGVTPCASSHWSGMSGCLANPTQHTGDEPNFNSKVDEHTPINLPDSHPNFPRRDDATTISTTEDPEGFPHLGASSSSKQTAASRKLVRIWTENLLFQLSSVRRHKEERSRSKRCAFVKRQKISTQSLNGKLTRPSEEREWPGNWEERNSDIAFREVNQEF